MTRTPTFILVIPLAVKLGEDWILMRRIEAGRRLYNATLSEALRRHSLLTQSESWRNSRTIADKEGRVAELNQLLEDVGFTFSAIITFAQKCKNEVGERDWLGSSVTARIAERVFMATQQYALGNREQPRFQSATRPLHSLGNLADDTGIIWDPVTLCVVSGDLTLPALLPSIAQDPYMHRALSRKTKHCRVLWQDKNGSRRWFVQLTQEGVAPTKRAVDVVRDNSASRVKIKKDTHSLRLAIERSKARRQALANVA